MSPTSSTCRGFGRDAVTPSELRTDASEELSIVERLGDVVVGPQLEPGDHVVAVVLRSHHDDRHVAEATQLATHLEAIEAGQPDVEQHQLDGLENESFDGLRTGRSLDDDEAFVLQQQSHECANRMVVFDHHHPVGHAPNLPDYSRPSGSLGEPRRLCPVDCQPVVSGSLVDVVPSTPEEFTR